VAEALEGRVALVTGSGSAGGLGRAISHRLARLGSTVVVCDLPGAGQDAVAAEIRDVGGFALALTADVSQPTQVDRLVATAAERLGRIDIVVNNAAAPQGADYQPTPLVPVDSWQRVVDVNLTGTFLVSRATFGHVRRSGRSGRIVNVSSVIGRIGVPARAAYAATKAGIIVLTQVLAQELAPFGPTVNAVCPGMMLTGRALAFAAHELGGETSARRQAEAWAERHVPMRRSGLPEEIAELVGFLCSDQAGYITGEAIGVDGGMKTVPVGYNPEMLP
jgi:3-oxoacyl-[acyl-carrier protein] reductase